MSSHLMFEKLLSESPQSVKDLMEGLKGLRENPEYHPEESTFEHIRIVVARLSDTGDIDLNMTAFLHDLFKLKTAIVNEKTGHPSSPLHDKEVAKFIRSEIEVQKFIEKFGANVETVAYMCEQHMRVKRLGEMRNSKRWTLMSHELFPKLCLFTLADRMHNCWEICYAKWSTESGKLQLPIGDVTYGWICEENRKMLAQKAYNSKHRINGKLLVDMGWLSAGKSYWDGN